MDVDKLTDSQKKNIVQRLERRHKESRSNQWEARRKWAKMEHYVAGRQYWWQAGGKVGRPAGHEIAGMPSATGNVDEEVMILNEIRRVYTTNIQRLTSYFFNPDVVPDTSDSDGKRAARIGRIFLSDHIRKTDPQKLKQAIARNLLLYNKSFIKVHWDPSAGRLLKKPEQYTTMDKAKSWFLGPDLRREGDVMWDVVNPRNILLPKFTVDLKKCDWLEELHVESTDYVYRRFGAVVKPEAVQADEIAIEGMGAGWLDDPESERGLRTESEVPITDRVLLKETFIRPCPDFQKGAIFTWANGQLLQSRSLLRHYPDIPYFDSTIAYDDKDIYGLSVLWDLIPIQDQINMNMSAMSRWLKMVAMMRLWIPSDANISENDLNNETGMAVKYDGARKPEWDTPPEINQSVYNYLGVLRDMMAGEGFANELSKMKHAMSGNALGILQEMDDTVFRPALESVQSMFSSASSMTLQIAADKISNPRLIKMSSKEGWQIMNDFRGDMLSGNFHAEINLMSGMPTNKVLRLEYLRSIYKDGLMKDYEIRPWLEFPNDNEAMEAIAKQYEVVDAKIKDMLDENNYHDALDKDTNDPIMVFAMKDGGFLYHDFDNHALFVDKLQSCMQENYDHWSHWVQLTFMECWNYHKQQLQASMMPPPGAPGAAPGSGSPFPPMGQPGAFPGPQGPGPMAAAVGGGINQPANPTLMPDSAQAPGQQPAGPLPQPMATGFTG